jgi:hypothetical protein
VFCAASGALHATRAHDDTNAADDTRPQRLNFTGCLLSYGMARATHPHALGIPSRFRFQTPVRAHRSVSSRATVHQHRCTGKQHSMEIVSRISSVALPCAVCSPFHESKAGCASVCTGVRPAAPRRSPWAGLAWDHRERLEHGAALPIGGTAVALCDRTSKSRPSSVDDSMRTRGLRTPRRLHGHCRGRSHRSRPRCCSNR